MANERVGKGTGRPFQRVADGLHANLTDGTYRVDDLLPSERQLADRFDVSRDTVQRVLRELRSEGWIEPEQGRGHRVVKSQSVHSPDRPRPVAVPGRTEVGDLDFRIDEAFKAADVRLDVYSLTSESLVRHIQRQTERITQKRITPSSIEIRMLLPVKDMTLAYPRPVEGGDNARLLERLFGIMDDRVRSLRTYLRELKSAELEVNVEVRHTPVTPTFKLYLLNGNEALHGFYELIDRSIWVDDDGEEVQATDLLGVGATMIHYVRSEDPGAHGTLFVNAAQRWFERQWEHSLPSGTGRTPGSIAGRGGG
ncbi:GntR family transcriptional regulator [Streptomyces sp. BR1]|uniref:GntR family transcriptional regulator n=1 Tax=Streptomyces sp. BR1 TaxID=1592323 RepID=UPI00402BA28B